MSSSIYGLFQNVQHCYLNSYNYLHDKFFANPSTHLDNGKILDDTIGAIKKLEPLEHFGYYAEPVIYGTANELVRQYRLEKRQPPVLDFDLPKSKSIIEIVKNIFRDYDGFCLGENHCDLATKDFLNAHMGELKEMGVKALFVEGVFLGDRKRIDEFNAGKAPTICPPEDRSVLMKARDSGIKIYPIDVFFRDMNANAQLLNLNIATLLQVEDVKKKNPDLGKYIVWVGARHTNTIQCPGEQTIPGISELLHIPSVLMYSNPLKQLLNENEKDKKREIEIKLQTKHPHIPGAKANVLTYV